MKYITKNEFEHFEFSEIHVNEIQYANGSFKICLDDVKITPENSCNRDIRKMRANGLVFTVTEATITSFVEEGYTIYDADGNLKEQEQDVPVGEKDYQDTFAFFEDAYGYSIEKNEDEYTFVIDGNNERTYCVVVKGSGDVEEWDKFLNLE